MNNIIRFIRRDDYTMTENIFKKIQNSSALDLLRDNGISINPPINIGLLLKKMNIQYFGANFNEVEKKNGYGKDSILGATIIDGNQIVIFYKNTDSMNRKRFTIAHELGHCCRDLETLKKGHVEFRRNQGIYLSEKEYQANVFAGELLIPQKSLLKICNQLLIPSLSVLSSIYNVSTNVMAARLDYLKLSYYKDVSVDEG